MSRYSQPRTKFPEELKFKATAEQKARADEMAAFWQIARQEVLRRSIDYFYTHFFLPVRSSNRTSTPDE